MKDLFIEDIDDIKRIQIVKEFSEHDILYLNFRIKSRDIQKFEQYIGKELTVKTDKDKDNILFSGIVSDLKIHLEKNSWYCDLIALSKTCIMDKEQKTRIYQDTEKTIMSIIEDIYSEYNFDVFFPQKEKISEKYHNIILQYNETDWQFINRLSAECGMHIYSNSESEVLSWIGKPERSAENIQDSTLVAINSSDGNHMYDLQINAFYNIGDVLRYNDKEYSVVKIVHELKNNYLYKTYTLSDKISFAEYHNNIKGLALSAKVTDIEGDGKKNGMIRVQFDIEKEKPANPIWICWTTPYSRTDLGFYCMPEIDEKVNVKFLSNNSAEVFAESNIRRAEVPDDVKVSDKMLKIDEKQILVSEELIKIKNDKCEIVIEKDKIHIYNEKCKIDIAETIKLSIESLFAEIREKEIVFDTGSDKIELGNSAINMSSDKIEINASKETMIQGSSEKIEMTSSGIEVHTKKMNVGG